jgi:hypothetical protein
MAEEQTDMFDQDDVLERIEIERILRETAELEAQRRAENRAFQEELRAQLGRPAADATPSGEGSRMREGPGAEEQTPLATPKAKGGSRPGAGRKPKSPVAASKVMRIPEQYEAAVRALIAHLDETSQLGRHYGAVTSEPIFLRSLHGKRQQVSFTVEPMKT